MVRGIRDRNACGVRCGRLRGARLVLAPPESKRATDRGEVEKRGGGYIEKRWR